MKKETLHIKVNPTHVRNELHFEIQKRNHMNIFRNRKAYTRKDKHKGQKDID